MSPCTRDQLPVLQALADTFTCTRLPGNPRLLTTACAARWRRAQEATDMGACRGCPVGAERNGAAPVEAPAPAAVVVDVVRPRRTAALALVRRDGSARLGDLVAGLSRAGLLGGRPNRLAERVVRYDLAQLVREGALRHLRRGWYGKRRAEAERETDRAARAWAESHPQPWKPRDLQHELVARGLSLGDHPRQTAHRIVCRLVAAHHLEPVGGGLYLATCYDPPPRARPGLQLDLPFAVTAASETRARPEHVHKHRQAAATELQLDIFAA